MCQNLKVKHSHHLQFIISENLLKTRKCNKILMNQAIRVFKQIRLRNNVAKLQPAKNVNLANLFQSRIFQLIKNPRTN
jgi:hypothetical protein